MEHPLKLLRDFHLKAHYGALYLCLAAGDGAQHRLGRLRLLGADIDLDGEEGARLHRVEFKGRLPFLLYFHHVEPLFVLLAEVDALQAAGIYHWWTLGEDLLAVDVT